MGVSGVQYALDYGGSQGQTYRQPFQRQRPHGPVPSFCRPERGFGMFTVVSRSFPQDLFWPNTLPPGTPRLRSRRAERLLKTVVEPPEHSAGLFIRNTLQNKGLRNTAPSGRLGEHPVWMELPAGRARVCTAGSLKRHGSLQHREAKSYRGPRGGNPCQVSS